jgi:hypothetical protein
MIIDRIQYQKVYPLGSYTTERIGLEASLDEGENPEEALNKLKVIVDTLHAETLTQLDLYRGTQVVDIPEQPISNEDKKKQQLMGFVEAITTCTSLKALQIFEKLVERENVSELYEAYHSTKKLLENV